MQSNSALNSISRFLIGLAGLVVIVTGLKAASGLLAPILLALFVVLFCSPIVVWMEQRRVPRWLAQAIVILGVIAAGLTLILFLGISVNQLSKALPQYQSLIVEQQKNVAGLMEKAGIESSDLLALEFLQPGKIIQVVLGFLSGILSALSQIGLTLFIFVYMLAGASTFSDKLQRGLRHNPAMLTRLNAFGRSISVYLFIKTVLGFFTALGQTLLLLALGVDFAVLWGVLSFLLNFIPNIGYVISLIPPVLLTLLKFGQVKAIIVFAGYTIINNIFDILIAPRYLGKGLDLSTLVTFLAVIFWSWILGPVGAFMALPLTDLIKKLLLESFDDTQLLATLAGAEAFADSDTPQPISPQPTNDPSER
ncbi:MAG: AI-2E family transporter [Microcoleaceae cyanobacterium]